MPYAQFDSFKLHYKDYPAQKPETANLPIVMLHGFSIDHRMWMADAEHFSQWYRVLLLDSKGHGLSDAPLTDYSRAHRVTDVVGFLDRLNIERAHVVGLSMGGTTVLGLALAHPERMASMTLVSTSAAGFNPGLKIKKIDEIAREKGIEAAKDRWIKATIRYFSGDNKHIGDQLEIMMREHSGAFWEDPMRGKYPAEDDLDEVHRIDLPTLILAGELDRPFVPLAKTLHEEITGSRLSIFESVGHMLNLEAPQRFRAELKQFLDDC